MQVLPSEERQNYFVILDESLVKCNSLELVEPNNDECDGEEFVEKLLNFESFREPAI